MFWNKKPDIPKAWSEFYQGQDFAYDYCRSLSSVPWHMLSRKRDVFSDKLIAADFARRGIPKLRLTAPDWAEQHFVEGMTEYLYHMRNLVQAYERRLDEGTVEVQLRRENDGG